MRHSHLLRVSCVSANDKGDTEVKPGDVHRSSDICLMADENSGKCQLADRLMREDEKNKKWIVRNVYFLLLLLLLLLLFLWSLEPWAWAKKIKEEKLQANAALPRAPSVTLSANDKDDNEVKLGICTDLVFPRTPWSHWLRLKILLPLVPVRVPSQWPLPQSLKKVALNK